jgi:hypothetical protein
MMGISPWEGQTPVRGDILDGCRLSEECLLPNRALDWELEGCSEFWVLRITPPVTPKSGPRPGSSWVVVRFNERPAQKGSG